MHELKIMLDAGHYGHYNRSPSCPEYYESIMTWKLHKLWIEEFKKYEGVTVGVTRADQTKDLEVYQRGLKAKGYDVFFSLHSNAVGSSANENVDYPIVYHQLDDDSKLPELLSSLIAGTMHTKQGWRTGVRSNGSGGEYYGVLRGSKRVGVSEYILEHSFHTCTAMAKWLFDENNLARLAEAEVAAIAGFYGLKKKESEDSPMTAKEKEAFEALEKRVKILEKEEEDRKKVYRYHNKLPDWCRNTISALHTDGKFAGAGPGDMDLSQSKMETLFLLARNGVFGEKYTNIEEK